MLNEELLDTNTSNAVNDDTGSDGNDTGTVVCLVVIDGIGEMLGIFPNFRYMNMMKVGGRGRRPSGPEMMRNITAPHGRTSRFHNKVKPIELDGLSMTSYTSLVQPIRDEESNYRTLFIVMFFVLLLFFFCAMLLIKPNYWVFMLGLLCVCILLVPLKQWLIRYVMGPKIQRIIESNSDQLDSEGYMVSYETTQALFNPQTGDTIKTPLCCCSTTTYLRFMNKRGMMKNKDNVNNSSNDARV